MHNRRASFTRTAASIVLAIIPLGSAAILLGCGQKPVDPKTVTVAIESSPTNLDPRIGVDAQSERIDELIFDSLVKKDAHFNLQPDLATSWDTPNPLTYIFHLRTGVKFHNGQAFAARDVKWTLDSMRNRSILTSKYQAYRNIASIDAPDSQTLVIHMKQPDAALLWNLSDGALGIVPYGSGRDFQQHPIGTGPFRFVSQELDKDVALERNPLSWQAVPNIGQLRFEVIPDQMTRALALRKGSADVASNALSPDMIWSMRNDKSLSIAESPGTVVQYLTFNLRDPYLRDTRVRQAIAYAVNRPLIIATLLRGMARPADSLLPPNHWAYTGDLALYAYDPQRAKQLLDDAGYKSGPDGVRFHLTMKTSNDGGARELAMTLQQQLRPIGIALDVRSFEFATFYSDISHGSFGMYSLRWIGGNEDPDIFHYAFASASVPPHGANRGDYSNANVDRLLQAAASESDQAKRRTLYVQVQQVLANEMPTLPLWFVDSVVIYNRRLSGVKADQSGNFYFLETAMPHQAQ
ncbi:MAG TPA: ABC transporter substrate-binding protein [Acidobacteriaceae bacterium]|nr:ABC transporter substrate-binding protein [Acidobacteriaceae bacterium]